MTFNSQKLTYNILAAGAALLTARLVRSGIEKGWVTLKKEEPPKNPADPETSWKEALIWSLATGVLVGMARMFAQRGTAAGWYKVMGYNPTRLE